MIVPVILSGGSGTRLWPLSRKLHPKQFINLVNETTLFQDTILRLPKGVAEPLNETDTSDGLALQVNARYYMQIFNQDKGKSLQRVQQIRLQDPLQYFFIFDFKEGS